MEDNDELGNFYVVAVEELGQKGLWGSIKEVRSCSAPATCSAPVTCAHDPACT